jgi:chemotaxis protein CheY-P-specific phosphatase CheC
MSYSEERCLEFARFGAEHAAMALAKMCGGEPREEPPRCWGIELSRLADSIDEPEDWSVVIFVDLTGALTGKAGLLLSRPVVDEILLRLAGSDPLQELDERGRSALSETGNIALSAVANALGELQAGIVMPTVPRLCMNVRWALGPDQLRAPPGTERAYVAETALEGQLLKVSLLLLLGA